MKPLGIALTGMGTIMLFVMFPFLLIFSAIGWGIALSLRSKVRSVPLTNDFEEEVFE